MSFPVVEKWELADLYEPDAFYTHGDNPAMKRFMSMAAENAKDGLLMDHRTLIIDRARRLDIVLMIGSRMLEIGMIFCRGISRL